MSGPLARQRVSDGLDPPVRCTHVETGYWVRTVYPAKEPNSQTESVGLCVGPDRVSTETAPYLHFAVWGESWNEWGDGFKLCVVWNVSLFGREVAPPLKRHNA